MRILLINTFYYPNMEGGAEHSTKLLAEALSTENDVAIFSIDSKEKDNTEIINDVKVYRVYSKNFKLYEFNDNKMKKIKKYSQKLYTYYNKELEKKFENVCKDFKPDIVHSSSLYGIPFTVWKISKNMGVPVVHTIRDTAIVSPVTYGHHVNYIIKVFHKCYIKKYSRYVDAVTAPSTYTLNASIKDNFKNASIKKSVFNSIEIDFKKLDNNIDIKINRKNKIIKFMYAGRLIEIKGIKTMINAFTNIKNENIELHICGDGELREYVIESTLKDNRIKYCKKLNKHELDKKYEECDVLIVPSEWPEPFGRVLIEANYYGMVVIATNMGGIPEIIDNMNSGVAYKCGDINKLIELMKFFMDRENIRKQLIPIKENINKYDIINQKKLFMEIYKRIKNRGSDNNG